MTQQHHQLRSSLDKLFQADAILSMTLGSAALIAPHVIVSRVAGGSYSHATHETVRYVLNSNYRILIIALSHRLHRLYACLRIACGWILWHVRKVDDGYFRRHVCEALLVCYLLQALTVVRAQWTEDSTNYINLVAAVLLIGLAFCYGRFRFGANGNLIKIYELPTGANLQ